MEKKIEMIEDIQLYGAPYFGEGYWTSPMNFLPEVKDNYPEETLIYDVTLRDGEQTPGVCWNEDERVRVAEALEEMGIKRLEIGMPVVSDTIAKAVKRLQNNNTKLDLVALCRAKKEDIDICVDMGLKSVIVEHSINPYLCQHALGLSVDALIDRLVTTTAYAKEKGLNTNFFGWDSFRTSIPYLQKVFGTVVREAKPDSVTLTDTVGVGTPTGVKYTVEKVIEAIGDTPLQFHGHNEFGMATAASLAALEGGAKGIHTAINGLGERTGNAATEEVVMALELLLGVKTGVNLGKIAEVSNLVAEIGKVPLARNKAIVGEFLGIVESGLVSDVVYKMRKLGVGTGMSAFTQELVGNPPQRYGIGKGSGKATVITYLEKNGMKESDLSKEQMKEVLERVKVESRIRKALLNENDLMSIVYKVING